MKRIYKTILGCVTGILLTFNANAQSFTFVGGTNNITDYTTITKSATISGQGIINVSEGKVPLVRLNITHTLGYDLDISLTSPEGTTINLSSDNGAGADMNTTFSHVASQNITSGSSPFAGSFMPEESFSSFDGEQADGVWTLTIYDDAAGDQGTFNSAFINVRNQNPFSYGLDNSSLAIDGNVYGNTLILPASGTSWTENIHNQQNSALQFSGTSAAVSTSNFFPTNGVTFAAWIKPTNVNADQKVITIADNTNSIDLLSLGVLNGTADFEVKEDGGFGRVTAGTLTNGEWAHICGTWSTSDNTVRLYLNGNLVGSSVATFTGNLSFSNSSTPGNYTPMFGSAAFDPTNFYYEGAMDDMRAFGYAMSPWQIKDIVANRNEYCFAAVDLPVSGNLCDGSYFAQNYGGNGQNGPTATCGNYNGGTSWFKVTVPASGNLNIKAQATAAVTSTFNAAIEVYSGTCGNLNSIDCNSQFSTGAGFAESQLTGLTPGDVLYVRTWEYNNNGFGQYIVCAFEPLPLSATPSNIAPLCNGSTNGSAFVSPTGGNAPYTFSWNVGGTDSSLVNIGAGTYVCTITDNSGVTYTETIIVSDPAAISVPTTTVAATGGNNNGTATANPTGGTAPYSYLWSNGNTSQTATSLGAGTFSVTITDANGCTSTGSATVDQSTAGLEELNNSITINLYPNPARDNVNIDAVLESAEETQITLMNTMGQVIQTVNIQNSKSVSHTFNVRELPAGTYFIRIATNSGLNQMKRLIVKK